MQGRSFDSIHLPVEVSGWDAEDRFFVEHSTLSCTELGEKTLSLLHLVRIRSLVFVKALSSDSFAKSHPEPQYLEEIERSALNKLHLKDFSPRRSGQSEPKDSTEHLISVRDEVKR